MDMAAKSKAKAPIPIAEERPEHDWMKNISSFALTLEHEGVLGIAQSTVAQTSSFAVSIASAATSAAFNVVSGASTSAVRMLTGNSTNNIDDEHNNKKTDEDSTSSTQIVLKLVFDITEIMLGAISPVLINDGNSKKNHEQNCYKKEKKMIEAEAEVVETRSLSKFYDADCCDCNDSVYFDATSSTDAETLWTGSATESSSMEENDFELQPKPVPENIIVREAQTYYLDVSGLITDVDDGLIPLLDNKFFAITDGAEKVQSLQYVLDILVDRSLRIANDDSNELCWKPDDPTKKILQRCSKDDPSERGLILESKVLKWTSTLQNQNMLKTQGIVNMSPLDLKDLLLDCDRVHLFNKHSIEKEDVCTFSDVETGEAKIVKNAVRIPIVGNTLQTLCITHSRCIEHGEGGGRDSYIIVTQSVKNESQESLANPLYSVSILRPGLNSDDKTELTTIAQISSMPIPKFLLCKVAFMCASDFFDNLRSLRS